MPTTCMADGPLIELLGRILQPHDLVCDHRYGVLWVVEREGVEEWKDETGMLQLSPPAGSALEARLLAPASFEFIETPLGDALRLLGTSHQIHIDYSRLPAELAQGRVRGGLITLNEEVSLRNGLGAMFDIHDLRARLDGETIVVELQPDHPLAKTEP
jgi:hypothetical protein